MAQISAINYCSYSSHRISSASPNPHPTAPFKAPPSSLLRLVRWSGFTLRCCYSLGSGMGTRSAAAESSPRRSLVTSNRLRHVESMAQLPSGAGKISHLNAVILGESLASEENDLVFPSPEFSAQSLVSSPEQVCWPYSSCFLLYFFSFFLLLLISGRCHFVDPILNHPR